MVAKKKPKLTYLYVIFDTSPKTSLGDRKQLEFPVFSRLFQNLNVVQDYQLKHIYVNV